MNRSVPSINNPRELPIETYRDSILYLLENHQVLIVSGETGSGKSTYIPEILYSSGAFDRYDHKLCRRYIIGITQPRRVAAIQLSNRVADILRSNVGTIVGYAIRFHDCTNSDQTVIKFMTEGLLLNELIQDPLLSRYSVIMIDEAHERSLNVDLLFGLMKCLLKRRDDLKLIICSATSNVDQIRKFFSTHSDTGSTQRQPAVIRIKGISFPLTIHHRKLAVPNYLTATVDTIIDIHESNRLGSGKILAFLTSQSEIDQAIEQLAHYVQASSSRLDIKRLVLIPMHASLKPEELQKAFEEHGKNSRPCILATNIAETSLTIEDVAFVIDCGYTKVEIYDPDTGVDRLVKVAISKSSAKQRAGRAGRTCNGHVYRLYTETEYDNTNKDPVPEIQRVSLDEVILKLKALGVDDIASFQLISPMPSNAMVLALEVLYALGAIDMKGSLTDTGFAMSHFTMSPNLSKILVSNYSSSCRSEICKIIAMLQVKELFVKRGRYTDSIWQNNRLIDLCTSDGDLISYLNIFNSFVSANKTSKWAEQRNLNYQSLLGAISVHEKLESTLYRLNFPIRSAGNRTDVIHKALLSGLFLNVAYFHPSAEYLTIRGQQRVNIHPMSVFSNIIDRPKYMVFTEILHTTKLYMRHLLPIEDPQSLVDIGPHFYSFGIRS